MKIKKIVATSGIILLVAVGTTKLVKDAKQQVVTQPVRIELQVEKQNVDARIKQLISEGKFAVVNQNENVSKVVLNGYKVEDTYDISCGFYTKDDEYSVPEGNGIKVYFYKKDKNGITNITDPNYTVINVTEGTYYAAIVREDEEGFTILGISDETRVNRTLSDGNDNIKKYTLKK